jgi:predicted TIM-barrel fold metal-dependent hydrolase
MSQDALPLAQFRPRSMLRVAEHPVMRPRFPVIDMHNHSEWGGRWQVTDVEALVQEMDAAGVRAMVDLDGGSGARLARHLEKFRGPYPDRFSVFATVDWEGAMAHADFGDRLARELDRALADGAEGLKVWKDVGLTRRTADGRRLAVSDPRLDPLWAVAAAHQAPVTIHVADPMAFFEPLDASNERYEELVRHPDWHFYGPGVPGHRQLLAELEIVLERHRATRFIGAHVASASEDLGLVGQLLDRHPNLTVDIAARTAELGRQPYTAHEFLTAHRGRVVFGLDEWPATREDYRVVFRMLETRDEYFPYSSHQEHHPGLQGRWRIYGIGLGDEALRSLYFEAALTVLPRLQRAVDGD